MQVPGVSARPASVYGGTDAARHRVWPQPSYRYMRRRRPELLHVVRSVVLYEYVAGGRASRAARPGRWLARSCLPAWLTPAVLLCWLSWLTAAGCCSAPYYLYIRTCTVQEGTVGNFLQAAVMSTSGSLPCWLGFQKTCSLAQTSRWHACLCWASCCRPYQEHMAVRVRVLTAHVWPYELACRRS
jgi:hypothetical protein